MSKLILPVDVKFGKYKGFVINITPLDDTQEEFVGVAVNEEKSAKFGATGKSRNEVGRQLESYIDNYRKFERRKLIIN